MYSSSSYSSLESYAAWSISASSEVEVFSSLRILRTLCGNWSPSYHLIWYVPFSSDHPCASAFTVHGVGRVALLHKHTTQLVLWILFIRTGWQGGMLLGLIPRILFSGASRFLGAYFYWNIAKRTSLMFLNLRISLRAHISTRLVEWTTSLFPRPANACV